LLDQVDEAIAYGGTADRNMPDLVVHGGDLALLDEQPQDTFSSQKGTFVDDWTGKAVDLEVEAWKQSVIARDRPGLRTSSPGIEAINDAKTQIVSDVPGDYLSPQLEANMRAFASLGSRWSRFWKTERVFVQGDHDVSLEDYAVAQKGIELSTESIPKTSRTRWAEKVTCHILFHSRIGEDKIGEDKKKIGCPVCIFLCYASVRIYE